MVPVFSQKSSVYGLFLFAIVASALLTFGINLQTDLVNPDAICYLMSAETIANQNLHAGMTLCGQAKWPLFSLLIGFLVRLTQLPYEVAAYSLDGFFTILTIIFYLLIVRHLGASTRILGWAVLIILFAPTLNSVREYIIRDHGYWAFYLLSFYFWLRFLDKPQLLTALLINASLILATLFRVEGFIFLLGLPWLVWLMPFTWQKKLLYTLQLNIITLSAFILLGLWLLTQPHESFSNLGRLNDVVQHLQNGFNLIVARFQVTKMALMNHVLTVDSAKHADMVLILLLCSWYVFSIISNLSWTYFLILVSGFMVQRWVLPRNYYLLIFSYVALNFIITLSFLLERMFLSKRYLIAMSLIFLLMVPFAWERLWQKTGKYKLIFFIILMGLGITSLSHYFNGQHQKRYIREAAAWIKNNIPPDAKLYSNDYQLMYYSQHYGDNLFVKLREFSRNRIIESQDLKHYDYLAVRTNKLAQKPLPLTDLPKETLKQFSNRKGAQVIIYKLNNEQ